MAEYGRSEPSLRRSPVWPVMTCSAVDVARLAEHPVGLDDVVRALGHCGEFAAVEVDSIQVPPVVAVGGHDQRAVGHPLRLLERFVAITHHAASTVCLAVAEFGAPQLGGVPWHVGVHPLHPHQGGAVGRHPGRSVEVGTRRQGLDAAGAVGGDGDDLVHGVGAWLVSFVDAHEPSPVGRDPAIGVAKAPRVRGLRRQQHGLPAGHEASEPLVAELHVEERALVDPPRTAAVFVHGCAHVAVGWRDVGCHAVVPADHGGTSPFGGPGLGPPHVVTVGNDRAESSGPVDEQGRGDGDGQVPAGRCSIRRCWHTAELRGGRSPTAWPGTWPASRPARPAVRCRRRCHHRPPVGRMRRSAENSAQRMATAHVPSPAASTQPTDSAVAAALEALDFVDQRQCLGARETRRRPAWARARATSSSTFGRGSLRWPSIARAEVLHVGDRDDRWLGLPVEVAAPRQQRVVDHVDHDPVLDLVLGRWPAARRPRGDRCRGRRYVVWCRRTGGTRTVLPSHRHQQLGHRADEAVDRVAIARPERSPAAAAARRGCRSARRLLTHDLAGDDGLGELAVAHRVACRA